MNKDNIRYKTCPFCNIKSFMGVVRVEQIGDEQFNLIMGCPNCGENHAHNYTVYKRQNPNGYISLSIPKLFGTSFNMVTVTQHIYVWEKHFGKPAPTGYVIHHINGIKTDNRIENLVAIPKASHNNNIHKVLQKQVMIHCPFCQKEFPVIEPIKE